MRKVFFLSLFLWTGCGGCGKNEKLEKAAPLFQKGLSLERDGQYSSAAEQYRLAMAAYPEYRDACFQLGNLYEKMGLAEKARDQYREVIALNDADAQAWNNLGNVLGQTGELDAAMDAYSKAIRLDPTLASAHYNLGQAYVLKRDFIRAESELRSAIELVPNEPKYTLALGMLYGTQQKTSDAIFYLEKSVRSHPGNASAYYHLALAYKGAGHYDAAIQTFEKYLTRISDIQEQNIIRIKIREIQMQKAREKLTNSMKRGSINP